MKILFTCGGTAGHVNPAVALARMFQQRMPGTEVLFVGADGGMETDLVPKEGFPIRTVTITSFYRSMSAASVKHNLKTVANLAKSRGQAKAILDEFRPDLVVGTGGYASFPVVREAARRHIPTAVHESNAYPGLTTRMLSAYVDKVMVGFEESRAHYKHPERVEVTGTPVRGDFFEFTREEARERIGLKDDRPLVLSYWGSLGARVMNQQMMDFIVRECRDGEPFHHLHGAGKLYYNIVQSGLAREGIVPEEHPSVEVREYIYDMPEVMAAADLVICRAGASTISELTALAKPAILVPSPNVTNNHQEKNAMVLQGRGAAVVVPEAGCSGKVLFDTAREILTDPARTQAMRKAASKLAVVDSAQRIYDTALELMQSR